MKVFMRRLLCVHLGVVATQWLLSGLLLGITSDEVRAQSDAWPSKPLRIIVPASAGGGTADPVSRVFADELTKVLGQRVFVENRGGSNGNIGAALAARSPNDGYTVLFYWAGTLATHISLY